MRGEGQPSARDLAALALGNVVHGVRIALLPIGARLDLLAPRRDVKKHLA